MATLPSSSEPLFIRVKRRVPLGLRAAVKHAFKRLNRVYKRLNHFFGLGFHKVISANPNGYAHPGIANYQVISPAREIQVTHPPALEYLHQQSYVPYTGSTIRARETFRCDIPNAIFDVRTGLVCTSDKRILLESGVDLPRIQNSSLWGDFAYVKLPYLRGTFTSIWGLLAHNYTHWTIECLLRLHSLEKAFPEPVTLLMPSGLSAVQQEMLSICLPRKTTVRYLARNKRVQVEKFIFLSPPTGGTAFDFPPPDYLDFIRSRVFARYSLKPSPRPSRRIYISRRKTGFRRVLNEEAVIRCLISFGFQSCLLEDLSFQEQVKLFHSAEVVVSPHSSGLINLLFAPRDTRVLEISALAPEPSFFCLTLALEQTYYSLFAAEANSSRLFPRRAEQSMELRRLINSDFTVDIDELRQTLCQMELT